MSMNIENQICEPRTNHGTAEQRENNEQIVSRIQAGEKEQENMTLLWQQNQNFIAMIARKYSSCAEMEDLEQEGYIGLYEAVKHYDTSSEVPLSIMLHSGSGRSCADILTTAAEWFGFQHMQSIRCSVIRRSKVSIRSIMEKYLQTGK